MPLTSSPYSGNLTFSFSLLSLFRLTLQFFHGFLHLWSVRAIQGWQEPLACFKSEQIFHHCRLSLMISFNVTQVLPGNLSLQWICGAVSHCCIRSKRRLCLFILFPPQSNPTETEGLFYERAPSMNKSLKTSAKDKKKKREKFSDQQRESKQPMRNTNAATVRVTKEQWRFFGEQEGGRITDRRQEYSTWKDRCVLSHAVDENGRRKALLWKNNHSAHRCYRCGLTIDLYVHMWQ